jgi:hypothetical protein
MAVTLQLDSAEQVQRALRLVDRKLAAKNKATQD